MAKLKKSAAKTTRKPAAKTTRKPAAKPTLKPAGKTAASGKGHAAITAKSITESAQQIWLAGMGAFNRAQSEGSKLFETLVRDGLSLEQTARKFAGKRAGVVRDVVEGHVEQARERAVDTWDKLEKVFEDRVQRALTKLGVPSREDLNTLTERVERLTEVLRSSNGRAPQKASAAAKQASVKKAKPATKPVAKPAIKSAAKPAKPRRKQEKPTATEAAN